MTINKKLVNQAVVVSRWAVLVAVIAFAVLYVVGQWQEVSQAISEIPPGLVVISLVMVLIGLGFGTLSWVTILNGIGPRVPVLRGSQVMLVGQLGKFIPGSVWSYVMQMELGKHFGILRPRILITSLYAAGVGVVASLILGSLALPQLIGDHQGLLWLYALLPLGLVCLYPPVMTGIASAVLKLFRRPPLTNKVSGNTVVKASVLTLLSYFCFGAHLWFLTLAFPGQSLGELMFLTVVIALSFSAGLFAFIFPSGFGVREAILIAAMSIFLSVSQATALSLVSRLMFTFSDLIAALVASLFVLIWKKSLSSQTQVYLAEEQRYEQGAG
jgi:glycosyltransferase 2 family protein